MNCKIKPWGNRIAVRMDGDTSGPIPVHNGYIQSGLVMGEIVGVGGGYMKDGRHEPISFSVGQNILFSEHSANQFTHENKLYGILGPDQVIAVLEKVSKPAEADKPTPAVYESAVVCIAKYLRETFVQHYTIGQTLMNQVKESEAHARAILGRIALEDPPIIIQHVFPRTDKPYSK